MPCLVLYDIPDDGLRTKVADICMDFGLDRIQYSAFSGPLNKTLRKELWTRLKRQVGKKVANVQLITINAEDWAAREVIERREDGQADARPDGPTNVGSTTGDANTGDEAL